MLPITARIPKNQLAIETIIRMLTTKLLQDMMILFLLFFIINANMINKIPKIGIDKVRGLNVISVGGVSRDPKIIPIKRDRNSRIPAINNIIQPALFIFSILGYRIELL